MPRVEDDRVVGRDHDPGLVRELRKILGGHHPGSGVHDAEPLGTVPVGVEGALGACRAVRALHDHVHKSVRGVVGRALKRGRQVAVCPVASAAGACRERSGKSEHDEREQAAPNRAAVARLVRAPSSLA